MSKKKQASNLGENLSFPITNGILWFLTLLAAGMITFFVANQDPKNTFITLVVYDASFVLQILVSFSTVLRKNKRWFLEMATLVVTVSTPFILASVQGDWIDCVIRITTSLFVLLIFDSLIWVYQKLNNH